MEGKWGSLDLGKWQHLITGIDGACLSEHSVYWYDKSPIKSDPLDYEAIRKDCTSLLEHCCLRLAIDLIEPGFLSIRERKNVIDQIPNEKTVSIIWNFVRVLSGDSFSMFCLFQRNSAVQVLSKEGMGSQKYRLQRLPHAVDMVTTIRFLNNIGKVYNFEYLTILKIDDSAADLSILTNLHSLAALSVQSSQLTNLVHVWHRSLAVDRSRWRKLRVLQLSQLRSPMLFFNTWKYIPSLVIFEVGIEPTDVIQIPILSNKVEHVDLKGQTLLTALHSTYGYEGAIKGVVFELRGAENSLASPAYYTYHRRESPITDDITRSKIRNASSGCSIKRPPAATPRSKRLKSTTSPQQFFGLGSQGN